jgi:hypothetical protein
MGITAPEVAPTNYHEFYHSYRNFSKHSFLNGYKCIKGFIFIIFAFIVLFEMVPNRCFRSHWCVEQYLFQGRHKTEQIVQLVYLKNIKGIFGSKHGFYFYFSTTIYFGCSITGSKKLLSGQLPLSSFACAVFAISTCTIITIKYFVWKSKYYFVYSLLPLWQIISHSVLFSPSNTLLTCFKTIILTL